MKSEWKKVPGPETLGEIEGLDCIIWLTRRPHYCDRGNFVAQIDRRQGGNIYRLNLDHQDGWPRYYMDETRAKAEIEDWLKKRKQWMDA